MSWYHDILDEKFLAEMIVIFQFAFYMWITEVVTEKENNKNFETCWTRNGLNSSCWKELILDVVKPRLFV